MSPLRRFWLAWFGGWHQPVTLVLHLLALAAMALATQQREDARLTPIPLLMLLPLTLGWRCRQLLAGSAHAMARLHHVRIRREWLLGLVPVMMAGAMMSVLDAGMLPVASTVTGTAIGAWIGISAFRSFLCWIAYSLLVLSDIDHTSTVIEQRWPGAVSLSLLASVLAGMLIAWHRLGRHAGALEPIPPGAGQRWIDLLSRTFQQRRLSLAPLRVAGPLGWTRQCLLDPDLRLHLVIGLPLAVLVAVAVPDESAAIPSAFVAAAVLPGFMCLSWATYGRQGGDAPVAPLLQGLLASERLRPWSRMQAAQATWAGIAVRGAFAALCTAGGLVIGSVAIILMEHRIPPLIAVLVPFHALASAAATAALYLFFATTRRPVAFLVGIPVGMLIVCSPVYAQSDSGGTIVTMIMTAGLALVAIILTPIAWCRLARADLG